MKRWWWLVLAALVVLAIFIWPRQGEAPSPGNNGENGSGDEQGQGTEPAVEIGYVNWPEATATSFLVKNILAEDLDVEATLRDMQAGLMWQSLATGDIDLILCAWLPGTHGQYYDQVEEDVVLVRENFQGARIGLVVPDYVAINSITELNENSQAFGRQIVGIDAGAGIMAATQEAIETYQLDLTLLESSDAAMTAELRTAVENQEWIVVTGWTPHWKFAEFDLKFLDDPENVYGGAETINTVTREGFSQDHPRVQAFLEKFSMTEEQLGSLLGFMEAEGYTDETARRWIEENRPLVDQWMAE